MASDDRSVNIGGNVIGSTVVTGDHNHVSTQSASTTDVDVLRELAALRAALADLDLVPKDRKKVDNALDEAEDEAKEAEPDRDEVGQALDRALKTVERAGKLHDLTEALKPHVQRLGVWLGTHGTRLAMMLGA